MALLVEESEFTYCDVADIARYLNRRNPHSATRFLAAFKRSVSLLSEMPRTGRIRAEFEGGRISSWRVTGFGTYLIFYEVLPDRLRLLRVLHGSRDLQAEFKK